MKTELPITLAFDHLGNWTTDDASPFWEFTMDENVTGPISQLWSEVHECRRDALFPDIYPAGMMPDHFEDAPEHYLEDRELIAAPLFYAGSITTISIDEINGGCIAFNESDAEMEFRIDPERDVIIKDSYFGSWIRDPAYPGHRVGFQMVEWIISRKAACHVLDVCDRFLDFDSPVFRFADPADAKAFRETFSRYETGLDWPSMRLTRFCPKYC